MAAAGNPPVVATAGFYDQPGYISVPTSGPPINNGRDTGFSKGSQVNHDEPPFSR